MKGCLLAPMGSFVFGESIYPLPKVFQKWDIALTVWPLRSLNHFGYASGPEPSFFPGAHATVPLQWNSNTSKVQSLSYIHYFQKNKNKNNCQISSPSSSVYSLRGFLLVQTLSHNLSSSLSPFSSYARGSLSSTAKQLFSLPVPSQASHTCHVFFSNHANTSSNLQIYFLAFQITWPQYSCVQVQESPRSPYFSAILTLPPQHHI